MRQEESIQLQVCRYISMQYKGVMFISDVASGIKLNMGQAVKASKMRSSRGYVLSSIIHALIQVFHKC